MLAIQYNDEKAIVTYNEKLEKFKENNDAIQKITGDKSNFNFVINPMIDLQTKLHINNARIAALVSQYNILTNEKERVYNTIMWKTIADASAGNTIKIMTKTFKPFADQIFNNLDNDRRNQLNAIFLQTRKYLVDRNVYTTDAVEYFGTNNFGLTEDNLQQLTSGQEEQYKKKQLKALTTDSKSNLVLNDERDGNSTNLIIVFNGHAKKQFFIDAKTYNFIDSGVKLLTSNNGVVKIELPTDAVTSLQEFCNEVPNLWKLALDSIFYYPWVYNTSLKLFAVKVPSIQVTRITLNSTNPVSAVTEDYKLITGKHIYARYPFEFVSDNFNKLVVDLTEDKSKEVIKFYDSTGTLISRNTVPNLPFYNALIGHSNFWFTGYFPATNKANFKFSLGKATFEDQTATLNPEDI